MRLRMFITVGILLLVTGCVPGSRDFQSLPPGTAGESGAGTEQGSDHSGPRDGDQPSSGVGQHVGQTPGNGQAPTNGGAPANGQSPANGQPPTNGRPPTNGQSGGNGQSPPNVLPPAGGQTPPPPATPGPVIPRLAILVYHDVADRASGGYTISQTQLEEHIQMLKDEGYAFYRLADVERLLAGDKELPEKGVMLAFDDGYQSFATRVLPVAQRFGVPAVCFMVTKYSDFDIFMGIPHMAPVEMRQVINSGLLELAGHSYDGHRTAETADGSHGPVLLNPIRKPQSTLIESHAEYAERVRLDFVNTAKVLTGLNAGVGARHFTFPYGLRSDEAVSLGREAGFQYFYIGTDQLVTPETDSGAIPRVHAGAPEISAQALRDRLRSLFGE